MNPRILTLAAGVAIGYVLGTRDGRARYEQMKTKAMELWGDPRVVRARRDVEAYARQQAPIIRDRAEAAAKAAPGVAKDVAGKVASVASDVAETVGDTAKDVRDRAGDVAADLRGRGEAAVDSAVETAGRARDAALDTIDDEDDKPAS